MGLAALGKLEQAYRHLHEADSFTRREPTIPMTLRLDVTTALCRLSNHLVMHSTSWCPSARRVGNLREALEHARMTGPLLPTLNALQGLTEYYSSVQRDEDSLRAAQFAILLETNSPANDGLSTRSWNLRYRSSERSTGSSRFRSFRPFVTNWPYAMPCIATS